MRCDRIIHNTRKGERQIMTNNFPVFVKPTLEWWFFFFFPFWPVSVFEAISGRLYLQQDLTSNQYVYILNFMCSLSSGHMKFDQVPML